MAGRQTPATGSKGEDAHHRKDVPAEYPPCAQRPDMLMIPLQPPMVRNILPLRYSFTHELEEKELIAPLHDVFQKSDSWMYVSVFSMSFQLFLSQVCGPRIISYVVVPEETILPAWDAYISNRWHPKLDISSMPVIQQAYHDDNHGYMIAMRRTWREDGDFRRDTVVYHKRAETDARDLAIEMLLAARAANGEGYRLPRQGRLSLPAYVDGATMLITE